MKQTKIKIIFKSAASADDIPLNLMAQGSTRDGAETRELSTRQYQHLWTPKSIEFMKRS